MLYWPIIAKSISGIRRLRTRLRHLKKGSANMRYYFNVKDGTSLLDDEGMEFDSLDAVKTEAMLSSLDLLKGIRGAKFWTGEPWQLWVTDQPNGGGNTLLRLTFTSRLAA